MTVAEISAALTENSETPYGVARSTRAEQLVAAAEETGELPLTITALSDQIEAYEYDGGSEHILVPFARLLRLWDEHPEAFTAATRHGLHWYFKWVTSGMISLPTVPLSTVRRWLDEMRTRYAQAGFSAQAFHACAYDVASHLGDLDEAQRTFDAWQAARRDQMSNCTACDRHNAGHWYVDLDRDDEALRLWEPVLSGQLSCAEEPHRALASSLLPLVRLGRTDAARANHLRGYRMVRGRPNLRKAVGLHLEFVAVTGNEARGLEILAEHSSWLAPGVGKPIARMEFLCGVGVLLRRLGELGHTDLPVAVPVAVPVALAVPNGAGAGTPGPGASTRSVGELLTTVERELAEITRQFDARNGTTAVSDRIVARLAGPTRVASLPLGARVAVPGTSPGPEAAADEAAAVPGQSPATTATATQLEEISVGQEALRVATLRWREGGPEYEHEVVDQALAAAQLLDSTDPGCGQSPVARRLRVPARGPGRGGRWRTGTGATGHPGTWRRTGQGQSRTPVRAVSRSPG